MLQCSCKFAPLENVYLLEQTMMVPLGPLPVQEVEIAVSTTEQVITYVFGTGTTKTRRREHEVFGTHEEAIEAARVRRPGEAVPLTFSQEFGRERAIEGGDGPQTRLITDSSNRQTKKR